MSRMRRLIDAYQSAALLALNTVVLIVILNVALLAFFSAKDRLLARSQVVERHGPDLIRESYPHRTEEEIAQLLDETWSRDFLYEPFTQFTEAPFEGRYVNVDEAGFRHGAEQGPWPPDPGALSVFVFGGSTTFGYGVADDETVPSFLQQRLSAELGRDVRVYNFGRGHYYSTQERVLFTQLVVRGERPDLAIFVDGLNDFFYAEADEPLFTRRLSRVTQDPRQRAAELLSDVPMVRAARGLLGLLGAGRDEGGAGSGEVEYDDSVLIGGVVERYLANRSAIEAVADAEGIRTLFVWQPVPTFGLESSRHTFSFEGFGRHRYSRFGYQAMQRLREGGELGEGFAWCADIHEGQPLPLYVDIVHYSAQFSERVAECIAAAALERGLLSRGTADPPAP